MTFEGKFVRYCTKRVVTGSTVVDAINDGDHIDPDGGDTTTKTGEARRASLLRNNRINYSGRHSVAEHK